MPRGRCEAPGRRSNRGVIARQPDKLDELIRAFEGAHNALLDLEELSQEELDKIRANYERLAEGARRDLRSGRADTGVPETSQDAGS